MDRADRIKLIDKIVKRMIEGHDKEWAMDINHWDWVPGVGLYGIVKAWKFTENNIYLQFIRQWVDEHLQKAYTLQSINSTAPLLTVLELYKAVHQDAYLEVCRDIADWMIHKAPRTREGGFEHTVTEAGADFSEQMWADTLFMACIFLSKSGKLTGNDTYINEAGKQLYIHHKVLKDHQTGLFYHGWNCNAGNWMSGALWGRANAWIAISTVEILENLPDIFEGRDDILQSLSEQAAALQKVQRANGMFGTLLNHTESYDETSATAGIACGIKKGIRLGYISDKYNDIWQKAEKATVDSISHTGEVLGVSTGTPVMPTMEAYKTVECCPTLYGQGLALMLLSER